MSNKYAFLCFSLGLLLTQAAGASTVWLKSGTAICKNTLSVSGENPQGIIGLGGIDASSNFTMTILNPSDGTVSPSGECNNIPTTGTSSSPTPIVFSGTLPAQYSTLNAWRTVGTGGAPECLKQGSNLSGIGVSGGSSLTSGLYTLTLSYSLTSDGCDPVTNTKTTGDGLPTFSRGATLTGGTLPFNGVYHIFDLASIPEPGSLALLLAGAVAAVGLRSRRRKAVHA